MLEANDFVDASDPEFTVFAAIDKSQLLAGNFVDYLYELPGYPANFRATVPAQMDDATPGEPMLFVQEAGYENGTAAQIDTLTDALSNIHSNSPTYTAIPVNVDPYGPRPTFADQPGAPGSVAIPIDTTVTSGSLRAQRHAGHRDSDRDHARRRFHHRRRFAGTNSHIPDGGTPSLVQEGTIDPGPGIATFYNGQHRHQRGRRPAASRTWNRPRPNSSRLMSPVRCQARAARNLVSGRCNRSRRAAFPMPESFRDR